MLLFLHLALGLSSSSLWQMGAAAREHKPEVADNVYYSVPYIVVCCLLALRG